MRESNDTIVATQKCHQDISRLQRQKKKKLLKFLKVFGFIGFSINWNEYFQTQSQECHKFKFLMKKKSRMARRTNDTKQQSAVWI